MKQGEKLKLQERMFEEDTQLPSLGFFHWLTQMHYVHRKRSGRCFFFPSQLLQKLNSLTPLSHTAFKCVHKWPDWHSGAVAALLPAARKETFWEGSYSLPWREKTDAGMTDVPRVTWVTILGFLWIGKDLHDSQSQKVKSGLGYFLLKSLYPTVSYPLISWLLFLNIAPKLSEGF